MDLSGSQESRVAMPAPSLSFSSHHEASKSSAPPGIVDSARAASVQPRVRYRECRKNFAASSGGYVVDGCGEFIPSGEEHFFKCAACQCHRNFHRKEVEGEPGFSVAAHSSAGKFDVAGMDNADYEAEKHSRSEAEPPVRKDSGNEK